MKRFWVELKHLWLEQVLELRTYWLTYVSFSLIIPLMMVFGLAQIGGGIHDTPFLLRLMTGSAIFAVANEALSSMAIRVASMRRDGMLLYYAALPIRKTSFILALILSRAFMVIPAALAPIVLGPAFYNIPVTFSVGVLLVLALLVLMLSGFGVLAGLLSPNVEIAQLGTNLLLIVLVLASPAFIDWEVLPVPLRLTSLALPFTYASDALKRSLLGDMGQAFWLNVLALSVMVVLSLVVVSRQLKWRLD